MEAEHFFASHSMPSSINRILKQRSAVHRKVIFLPRDLLVFLLITSIGVFKRMISSREGMGAHSFSCEVMVSMS